MRRRICLCLAVWLFYSVCYALDIPHDICWDVQEAVKLNPKLIDEVYRAVGLSYANAGKLNEAIEIFEKLNKITGDQAFALHRMGEIYLRQGKDLEAQKTYERLVKATPQIIENYYPLIELYQRTNQKKKLKTLLKDAEKANPGNELILIRIAKIRANLKSKPKPASQQTKGKKKR